MTAPKTRAGRDPDEALEQIAAQAQPRSTCPVCKGEKKLAGRALSPEGKLSNSFNDAVTIQCPKCDGEGTVPAAGDLAQWRERALKLARRVQGVIPGFVPNPTSNAMIDLQDHLAAMPAQDEPDLSCDEPGCLLEGIEHFHEKEEPFCAECAQALLRPAQAPNAELLGALKWILKHSVGNDHMHSGFCPAGGDSGKACRCGRDAIAQAEQGAAGKKGGTHG